MGSVVIFKIGGKHIEISFWKLGIMMVGIISVWFIFSAIFMQNAYSSHNADNAYSRGMMQKSSMMEAAPMMMEDQEMDYDEESADGFEGGEMMMKTGRNLNMNHNNNNNNPDFEEDNTDGTKIQRMIIKNGQVSIYVNEIKPTESKVVDYIESVEGLIMSTSSYNENSKHFTLKVPAETFEKSMEFLKELSQGPITESSWGEDVTEQFLDSSIRLKNLEITHQKLTKLMEKAETVEETLHVQRELNRITEQMEVQKGKLQYLSRRTRMSEINFDIYLIETYNPHYWSPFETFHVAGEKLVRFGQILVDGFVYFLVFSIPVTILLSILGFILFKLYKCFQSSPSEKY